MRELKLRAWDEHTKTFTYIDLRKRPPDVNMWQSDDLQQFTGLQDVNGRDIYEGDIVAVWTLAEQERFEVFWRHRAGWPGFALFPSWHNGIRHGPLGNGFADYAGVEVIGNIHENSELILLPAGWPFREGELT